MNRHLKFFHVATIVATTIFGMAASTSAAIIVPAAVSSIGSVNNLLFNVHDGLFPSEGSTWNLGDKVWWTGQTGSTGAVITFDYGASYFIDEIDISVDNNDDYRIEYSGDGIAWASLFQIAVAQGEIGGGMDTMSSDSTSPEYIGGIDFATVQAQYLRVFATGGDSLYSIGELQVSGSVVPEPGTLILLIGSLGLLSLGYRQ